MLSPWSPNTSPPAILQRAQIDAQPASPASTRNIWENFNFDDDQFSLYLRVLTRGACNPERARQLACDRPYDFLTYLLRAQMVIIPYTNFACRHGAVPTVSLDMDDIVEKLLVRRVGGSRLELNMLLVAALAALDYECWMTAAKFQPAADVERRTCQGDDSFDHMVAIVGIKHRKYLIDASYHILSEPLRLLVRPLNISFDNWPGVTAVSRYQSDRPSRSLTRYHYNYNWNWSLDIYHTDLCQWKTHYTFCPCHKCFLRPGQLEGINHLPCSNNRNQHHLVAKRLSCSGTTINGIVTFKEDKWIKSTFMGLQYIKDTVVPLRSFRAQEALLRLTLGVDMAKEQMEELLLGKAHEPETPLTSTVGEEEMFDDDEEDVWDENHEQDGEQQGSGIEETLCGKEMFHEQGALDEQPRWAHLQRGSGGVVTHDEAEEFGFQL